MNFFINVKHLSILISTDEDELIKKLESEFHFFSSMNNSYPQFEIRLIKDKSPKIPELIASKILPHALVYHHNGARYIDYHGKALIHQVGKVYSIYCEDFDFLFELSFLTIHSLLGDLLGEIGHYRIHALAGTYRSRDFILMLPSGGGKSTMLAQLLEDPEFRVISDDSPIIDRWGEIHPFPTKISLSSKPKEGILSQYPWMSFTRALHPHKYVLSFTHLSERINKLPQDERPLLILGKRSSFLCPQLMKMSPAQTILALGENMIIGVGLPQVIEIFLSFKYVSDIYKMTKASLARSRAAFHLYRRSEHYQLTLSIDIKANCQMIKDLVNESHS